MQFLVYYYFLLVSHVLLCLRDYCMSSIYFKLLPFSQNANFCLINYYFFFKFRVSLTVTEIWFLSLQIFVGPQQRLVVWCFDVSYGQAQLFGSRHFTKTKSN